MIANAIRFFCDNRGMMMRLQSVAWRILSSMLALGTLVQAQGTPPLELEKTIPMAGVTGRIDHLSLDLKGQRLFIAALGNNSIEVIDLKAGKRRQSLSGLEEPQGVLFLPSANRLYVACGGDGTLRIYDGSSLQPIRTVRLSSDADNVRYDPLEDAIYVGYGSGALGVFRPDGERIRDIGLEAHPESFQLEEPANRVFVNLPGARKIVAADRKTARIMASWPTGGAQSNYPMAFDQLHQRLFVAFRQPAQLHVYDTGSGRLITQLPAGGDSDDVFYDAKRQRIYAINGEGNISVYVQDDADNYRLIATVPTAAGTRTGWFSPELDRLFVAVRQHDGNSAAIGIYKPALR
jgi:DNA-binding beta-propeller fold protein YncE